MQEDADGTTTANHRTLTTTHRDSHSSSRRTRARQMWLGWSAVRWRRRQRTHEQRQCLGCTQQRGPRLHGLHQLSVCRRPLLLLRRTLAARVAQCVHQLTKAIL